MQSLSRVFWKRATVAVAALLSLATAAQAEVKLPNIFTDHMVLQQGQKNKVWGKAAPDEEVTVSIGGQTHKAKGAADGSWSVFLEPLPVGGPHQLKVNNLVIDDVLVGEVWVCSGQSNMQWSINVSNDPDLERLAAKFPKIRMINFPQVGTQEPIWSHDRKWEVCAPDKIGNWSAVGFFFARQLHLTLDVPVGMINNAWGGSACEAWIARDVLAKDEKYKPLMERWVGMEKVYNDLLAKEKDLTEEQKKQLGGMRGNMGGNSRPGNIYNGVLKSHLGYGIKGAIWYQGESNAGRAYQYRDLFPLMIDSWRKEWAQGDFPFYWVQLADFKGENPNQFDSDWAELREAQTMTMSRLPNTGEAVIIDIGEGKDIHPKNKVDVGRRLARWALAKDYKVQIPHHSPQYKSMEKQGNKIVLTFDHLDGGWRPFDVNEPRGFIVCGPDKKWVPAKAALVKDNKIEVQADGVADPIAVRYGWADNPVVNLFNGAGLPLTPFRTDDFPGVTINNK